jgi:hypothetical protein
MQRAQYQRRLEYRLFSVFESWYVPQHRDDTESATKFGVNGLWSVSPLEAEELKDSQRLPDFNGLYDWLAHQHWYVEVYRKSKKGQWDLDDPCWWSE